MEQSSGGLAKSAPPPVGSGSSPAPLGAPPPGVLDASGAVEDRVSLISSLDSILRAHCSELGRYIDGRLAAHQQELLRTIVERPPGSQGPVATCNLGSAWQSEIPSAAGHSQGTPGQASGGGFVALSAGDTDDMAGDASLEVAASMSKAVLVASLASDYTSDFDRSEQKRIQKSRLTRVQELVRTKTSNFLQSASQRAALRRCIEAPLFEFAVCFLIISNVTSFGIEVQSCMGMPADDCSGAFIVMEQVFTGIFSCELALRMIAYGPREFCCGTKWAWNVIDTVLVLISIAELILEFITAAGVPRFTYARVIRVARTVRIFRVVRIIHFFRPLRILVFSICNTVRSLFWTLILLTILLYAFGVLFTMGASQALAANTASNPDLLMEYFGSLSMSIYSLFKAITGGVDWRLPADALSTLDPFWVSLFVLFMSFNHFAIMNVVTGVVCQTAIESAQQDQDVVLQSRMAIKQKYIAQLQGLFAHIDVDRSGLITLSDFEKRLQDHEMKAYFEALDLTTDQAWSLFKLLDVNGNFVVSVDDFVSGCLKLRGPARSIDIHMLLYESRWTMKKLADVMQEVQRQRRSSDTGVVLRPQPIPPNVDALRPQPVPPNVDANADQEFSIPRCVDDASCMVVL